MANQPYQLPPDISMEKERADGGWAFLLRHRVLGLLGRIVVKDAGGQCLASMEVAGDLEDPMTGERRQVLEPVAREILALLPGGGARVDHEPPVPAPPSGTDVVESKLIPCANCSTEVAHLIFADGARDDAGLEDYARVMYAEYKRLDLPTWVISGPRDLGPPPPERPADVMQVWPVRGPVRRMTPDQFNRILDELRAAHCR